MTPKGEPYLDPGGKHRGHRRAVFMGQKWAQDINNVYPAEFWALITDFLDVRFVGMSRITTAIGNSMIRPIRR